jgi:hypothetical protein
VQVHSAFVYANFYVVLLQFLGGSENLENPKHCYRSTNKYYCNPENICDFVPGATRIPLVILIQSAIIDVLRESNQTPNIHTKHDKRVDKNTNPVYVSDFGLWNKWSI